MEQSLLAASIRSRADYELVRSYIDMKLSTYSKLFVIVMSKVGDYYARDGDAKLVLPEILLAQINETIRNEKHVERIKDMLSEAAGLASSDLNVRAVCLLAKRQEVGDRLTQAILGASKESEDELLAEYQKLRTMTSIEETETHEWEEHTAPDIMDLITREFDPANIIKVYPESLTKRLDGGAKRGHHITVYGRPESMKSGTCINANAGFLRQGLKTIYFINEDRPDDITLRHISNLSGMTKRQIEQYPEEAMKRAYANGYENYVVVSCAPGTPAQIEAAIEKHQPACIVVDQLRNLKMKADNRVNQLEYAATAVRTIAKKCDVLALSVTQAGDSGEGKAVLDMGDVDFSNTGIPAQADVMIGVGVDPTLEAENRRMLSLPKNKISGDHAAFPVRVDPSTSRVYSE